MKYMDMIKQIEGFKYSANIKYDLKKDNNIIQYIPTENSLDILRTMFQDITRDTISNKQNARLIYGPYGSGKSFTITILASILNQQHSQTVYSHFINKIDPLDSKLSGEIQDYLDNSLPYLIVPINGSLDKFEESVYYSTIKVLEEEAIECDLKYSYLDAIKIIETWENQEGEIFFSLLKSLYVEHQINGEELKNRLKNFEPKALDIFKDMFLNITGGIEFNPIPDNLYENLDHINEIVAKADYRGIIFIFDEFGKYLEDNIKKLNAKTIQDLAEYCNHNDFQNHIIFISHKQILQYVNIEDRTEWEKIESRFQPISFEQSDKDTLYLMKNILIKEGSIWENFMKGHKNTFEKILDETLDLGFYTSFGKDEIYKTIYDCFPLHPIVAYSLNALSKKIAQNERTIFTFLAGDEENSLGEYLKKWDTSNFYFLGMDSLYDYFETNISRNTQSSEYEEWLNVQNAINKLNSKDKNYNIKIKIAKSIAAINIIDNYELLKPDKKTLCNIIDEDKLEIKNAIDEMADEKIIVYFRQYKYYRFFDISSLDVEKLIEDTMAISNNTSQAIEFLNKKFIQFPVLPDRYNFGHKMIRYYHPVFALDSEIGNIKKKLEKEHYDGLLIYVFGQRNKEEIIPKLTGKRVIYVLRDDSYSLIEEVKKLIAIEYLLTQKNKLKAEDPKAIIEIIEYKKELENYIENYVVDWSNPAGDNRYIIEGEIQWDINTIEKLSEKMSKEMESHFNETLIVNNELINKNKLSNPMIKARKEIIEDLLFQEEIQPTLGYKELSTNYTFVRSLLEKNKILDKNYIGVPKDIDSNDPKLINAYIIMEKVDEFIEGAENKEANVGDLVKILKSEPHGLRDGYIMVLFAAALRKYKSNIFIKLRGIEQELSGELFERIAKYPNQYTLSLEYWDEEKENYIKNLETEYYDYINQKNRKKNRLKALHEGILNHYKSISKFGRSSQKYVNSNTIKYRELVEMEIEDYRDFFFKEFLPITSVIAAKQELENIDHKLTNIIENSFRQIFKLDGNKRLSTQILDLYNENWKNRVEYNINYNTSKFIQYTKDMDMKREDHIIVQDIGLLITGFEGRYWGDEQVGEFISTLEEIYQDLEKTVDDIRLQNGEIKLSLQDEKGNIKRIQFDRGELSDNGLILKKLISTNMENFGQALSFEDKRQILYEILMEYI